MKCRIRVIEVHLVGARTPDRLYIHQHTVAAPRLASVAQFSGGNSLFPVRVRSFLNFRQNFKFQTTPPPPFALEKAVFSPLKGKNFRKFVILHESGGRPPPPPPPRPPRFPPLAQLVGALHRNRRAVRFNSYPQRTLCCIFRIRSRFSKMTFNKHHSLDFL